MNTQVLQDVLASPRLPTPPAIALRIIEMTSDPNVTPAQLTDLVQADSALSSKILKTVNSAFYGLSTPVASIKRAQIMLGLSAIKSLTLGFSLVESLGDDEPGDFDYPAFWSRSLHAAACAKAIAAKTRCMEPEEALLGGLLQDVGMVILHRTLGQPYDEAIKGAEGLHRKISAIELAEFDITHPLVASTFAERWRFPATLITSVRYHEQPTAAPKAHQKPVRCIGLASLGASVLTEAEPAAALRAYLSKAQSWFALQAAEAEAILEEASSGAREFSKLLEVPRGAPTDARAILEAAKDQLVDVNLEEQIDSAVGKARAGLDTDELTGVATRRAFLAMLEDAHQRAADSEGDLTVATFDVEAFRDINEQHGRETGDRVLTHIAQRLRRDFTNYGGEVARVSDETFALLLPGVDSRTAAKACKAVVEAVATEDGAPGGAPLSLRAGITTMDAESARAFSAPLTLLTAAEQALDAARHAGGRAVRAFVPQSRAAA